MLCGVLGRLRADRGERAGNQIAWEANSRCCRCCRCHSRTLPLRANTTNSPHPRHQPLSLSAAVGFPSPVADIGTPSGLGQTTSLSPFDIHRSHTSFGLEQKKMATSAPKATQNSLQDLIPLVNSTLPLPPPQHPDCFYLVFHADVQSSSSGIVTTVDNPPF